jgi:AraC family transcriptional regulator
MLEIKNLPQMIYAATRGTGAYMDTAGPSFGRLMAWAGPKGLVKPGAKILGLSWDDPTKVPAERQRYDAAVTIDRPMDVPEGFHIAALPALGWATLTHKGSYAKISETFGLLMEELKKRPDLIVVGLCGLENYTSGPDTPEADLRTEVSLPVVKVG